MDEKTATESGKGFGELIAAAIEGTIAALGAVAKKNALIAFNRLLVSAADIANAKLQRHVVLTNAETAAQKLLVEAAAKQLAKKMEVDADYVIAASEKFTAGIVGKRLNIERTVQFAIEDLQTAPMLPPSDSRRDDISPDWLNIFESEAQNMSTEQAQRLFGKILSGEIRRPGSFSMRTVKLLAELDNDAAEAFVVACSVAVGFDSDSSLRDVRIALAYEHSEYLDAYGLTLRAIDLLKEYGLLTEATRQALDCRPVLLTHGSIADVPARLLHQGRRWVLAPTEELSKDLYSVVRPMMHGLVFTRSAVELFSIVQPIPNPAFTEFLQTDWGRFKLRMIPADN